MRMHLFITISSFISENEDQKWDYPGNMDEGEKKRGYICSQQKPTKTSKGIHNVPSPIFSYGEYVLETCAEVNTKVYCM